MMKKNINNFIKEHTYINYCEVIIHKDGTIEYARPSHVEALIRITGKDRNTINKIMPITASPIIWLTKYTECVSVYSNGYIKPNHITQEQEISLQKLIINKLVANVNFMED